MTDTQEHTRTITVPDAIDRIRADIIVSDAFEDFSRQQIQAVFDAGEVFLNDRAEPIAKNRKVSAGDVLRLRLPDIPSIIPEPVPGELEILYEDEDLVAVNKAPGVVTHPGTGTGPDTLVHFVLHHTQGQLAGMAGQERPGVIHRLDKETSGVIVFAKSDRAYLPLTRAFAQRRVHKEYLALAAGSPELDCGTILQPIGRHQVMRHKMTVSERGRPAHTDWQVQERFGSNAARFHCIIHTGRTHQIRVHLSWLGHPILGDKVYGYKPKLAGMGGIPRVMLHAAHLVLPHPCREESIDLRAPVPDDFRTIETRLRAVSAQAE